MGKVIDLFNRVQNSTPNEHGFHIKMHYINNKHSKDADKAILDTTQDVFDKAFLVAKYAYNADQGSTDADLEYQAIEDSDTKVL